MPPREIVSKAIEQKLFSDKLAGKTPHQTMKSKLSVDVRRNGNRSHFVRTGPGLFYLRSLLGSEQAEYVAKPIVKPPSREHVLTIDSCCWPEEDRFQGIRDTWKAFCRKFLRLGMCNFIYRLKAEKDESRKQVLTYIMVTRNGAVLAYKRGNYNRVEDFLRGSHCIGFGGHVCRDDFNLFTTDGMGIWEAATRELNEELHLPQADKLRLQAGDGLEIVGLLNDDSSEAGKRHVALLFRYEVSPTTDWSKLERGEKAITQLRWLRPGENPTPIWEFEYWSQLCLRKFFPGLVQSLPMLRVLKKRRLSERHVLVLVGGVASGKTEATKFLKDQYSYREINTGKVLANLLNVPPVGKTLRESFQKKAMQFISSPSGPELLADAILSKIKRCGSHQFLVDGVRQKKTLELIRDKASDLDVRVIYVHSQPDLAFQLYRAREAPRISFDKFLRLREAPVEQEVPAMIGDADAVLYNCIGKKAYNTAIRELMQVWGSGS